MYNKKGYTLVVIIFAVIISGCSNISGINNNEAIKYRKSPKVYHDKNEGDGQSIDTLKSFPEKAVRVGLGISGAGVGAYGVGSLTMGKEKWRKTVKESDTEETPSILKKYPTGPALIAAAGVSALIVSIVWPGFLSNIFDKKKKREESNISPKEIKKNITIQESVGKGKQND